MRHPNRRFTADQEAEIARRYAAGETFKQLQAEYGGCALTIRNVVKREGVESRGRGAGGYRQWTSEEIADMADRWQAGETQYKISRVHHTSQVTVSRLLARNGIAVESRRATGDRHGMWAGGRHISPAGYVYVLVGARHRFASMRISTGYVAEHRLAMAEALGRPLRKDESVHHINGDRQDNRIENLQLRTGKHGNGAAARCASCGSHDIVFDTLD